MQIVSQIGGSTLNGLSYVGSLASLGARAAYYTLVAPFQGKPPRLQRAIAQAMETGVRALPILSLITFFYRSDPGASGGTSLPVRNRLSSHQAFADALSWSKVVQLQGTTKLMSLL